MRFIVRPGSDPVAKADATLLKALGLPSGGVINLGRTHVLVRGGQMAEPSAIELGPLTLSNAGISNGQSIEVNRSVLVTATRVVVDADTLPAEPKHLLRAWQGRPLSTGDRVVLDSYLEERSEPVEVRLLRVDPNGAGLVGAATSFGTRLDRETAEAPPVGWPAAVATTTTTTQEALTAGLGAELDLLSGWLALLTSPQDLPAAWGLPRVAGVILEGPHGCGKSELVAAAAANAGAAVKEVSVDMVFKPERLLDVVEAAVKNTTPPAVIFVDRLEAVVGEEGMAAFRTQAIAILRWFLDAVAEKPGLACVLGVTSRAHLDPSVLRSPLLPRALAIPPPDLNRRRLLFEAALAKVPSIELDYEQLASRSAGFSAADVIAAVIHASTGVARTGERLTTAKVLAAVENTTPSLGSIPAGEMPSYGFEKVANLAEVKQRLTEAVIWPITDPGRFRNMGIEPPRGILLYGPPGTGKTFVVRALAHEAAAAFFSVKGAELLDKYVGESERAVREIFARARAASPAILFFDEIDALAPVRGRSTTSVTDSVVAAMLTEIDGISTRGDVAVIGATNRRDLIDPALLRAGRFEVQIELGLPDPEGRLALLKMSDVPFAADVDLMRLAGLAEGLSYADLSGVLREAALLALREDLTAREVRWEHVGKALLRFQETRRDVPIG